MEDKKFYETALLLMLQDYKNGKLKMTLKDAYEIYDTFNIITEFNNGELEFRSEEHE